MQHLDGQSASFLYKFERNRDLSILDVSQNVLWTDRCNATEA